MKFETVRIHFLVMLPWQSDITTSLCIMFGLVNVRYIRKLRGKLREVSQRRGIVGFRYNYHSVHPICTALLSQLCYSLFFLFG